MRASFGNGGWVAVDDVGLPGPLYLRMSEVDERLRVTELYIDATGGQVTIDAKDLRDLPITQIEEFINIHADRVLARMSVAAPDLSTLASYFSTLFSNQARQLAAGNWVVASFASQQLPDGVKWAAVQGKDLLTEEDAERAEGAPRVMRVERAPRSEWQGLRESDREFRLSAGPTEGLTDDFLRDVARAYTAAVLRGERPNVAIAAQTGYPLKTVQRWVYTARLRRIMPRGQQGRTG